MADKISPFNPIGPEFSRPSNDDLQITRQVNLPKSLPQSGISDPVKSTGLPKDVQQSYYFTVAAALSGLRI